jgi:hypothetical protein
MAKTDTEPGTEENTSSLQDVDIACAARLVRRGRRFYVSLPSRTIDFWQLDAKDEVLVKILKVKRQKRPVFLGTRC